MFFLFQYFEHFQYFSAPITQMLFQQMPPWPGINQLVVDHGERASFLDNINDQRWNMHRIAICAPWPPVLNLNATKNLNSECASDLCKVRQFTPKKLFRPWDDDDNDGIFQKADTKRHQSQHRPTARIRLSYFENVLSKPVETVGGNTSVIIGNDERKLAIETLATNLGKSVDGMHHRCIYCGKIYSRKYGLKIHLRTHTGFRPLKCKFCSRPFGDPSNLNKHMRLHAENGLPTTYRCQTCDKSWTRKRDMERHLNTKHIKTYV